MAVTINGERFAAKFSGAVSLFERIKAQYIIRGYSSEEASKFAAKIAIMKGIDKTTK
jgi:hypothetical protein